MTFLRTDIEGQTRLWQTRGGAMAAALDLHDRILDGGIVRNHGRAERHEGDSFFAVFPRPSQAVTAAFEIQQELEAQAWQDGLRPRVRIGVHTGEAGRLCADGRVDTRGLEANICGRLSDLARGGQVLLTLHTALFAKHALPPGAALEDLGWRVLRDVADPQRIFELVTAGEATAAGRLEPAPLVPHTQDDVDRALAGLARKVRTVAANLHEFQGLIEYRLLLGTGAEPGDHLTGETRSRVVPAFQAMQRLSLQLGDLHELLDRATELRGTAATLRPEQVEELGAMRFGPSIRLLRGRVPIELRRMDEDPESYLRITPDDLLRALENAFEFARDVMLDVRAVVTRAGPALAVAARAAGALEARARELGEAALAEELAGARHEIETLREQTVRDPLGMAEEAERAVEPRLARARIRLSEVESRRDAISVDVRRAAALLVEIETVHTAAEREYRWAREMIERPPNLVAPPDPALLHGSGTGLAPRLRHIETMTQDGAWRSAGEAPDAWLREAERMLDEGRRALAANRAPRERREELRGLLGPPRDERAKPGRDEDPEVGVLAERARTLLWTAPTDLDEASRAIEAYLARLGPCDPSAP